MAIFNDNSHILNDRLDWAIFQNGWSSLYCKEDILEKDLNWIQVSSSAFEMPNVGATPILWDGAEFFIAN